MACSTQSTKELPIRKTARLVLLDDKHRIFMLKIQDHSVRDPTQPTTSKKKKPFWITPGGRIEPNEDGKAAAQRELFEETGIQAKIGPCVWYGSVELNLYCHQFFRHNFSL